MSKEIHQAEVQLCNARGLHARASAKFVKLAAQFSADIRVSKDGDSVSATSIMGLMMLVASKGKTLTITAEGADAHDAIDALAALINSGFGEDA